MYNHMARVVIFALPEITSRENVLMEACVITVYVLVSRFFVLVMFPRSFLFSS